MAESCPIVNSNILSATVSLEGDNDPKQDCTSPSPTETICLDADTLPSSSASLDVCDDEEEVNNECSNEEENEKEETWEDCVEDTDYLEESENNYEVAVHEVEVVVVEDNVENINHTVTPKSSLRKQFHNSRIGRKRKLDEHTPLPCKKLLSAETDSCSSLTTSSSSLTTSTTPLSTGSCSNCIRSTPLLSTTTSGSTTIATATATAIATAGGTTPRRRCVSSCLEGGLGSPLTLATDYRQPRTPRAVIPTKDNPPPEMSDWLLQFQRWSNAERILALNELISGCEPTQVRHMMAVIEPQFQRDFISLLPRELALAVLAFLGPRDLVRAAQTCRSWRFLADDNLLWREKCRAAGIEVGGPRERDERIGERSPSGGLEGKQSSISPWKAAYMRQHYILMNWRVNDIPPPKMLKGHDDHVITCLQFCGNKIVSGSDDNTLKVWSAITGKCLRTLVGHTGGVWSSQMAGSVIISGSTDRTLKVWDAETGVCVHTLYGHTSTVRCMHLHQFKVVSGSRDATLRVWDIESGDCLHVLVGHLAAVRCVQYDGRLVVSGAYDYMVKVWNPEREECLHTLQGHTNRVYSLQFDGVHVVSGSLDTSIRVWEVETGACRHTLMGHQSLTSGMELRNNILVSGNADSTVKVWDIVTGQCLQTLSGIFKHQSAVTCLQFNSRFVITSSDDGTVKLWDVETGEFIRNLVALDSGGSGGVVWRIRASDTKLVCAVGSRNGTEETKLLVLDFDSVEEEEVVTTGATAIPVDHSEGDLQQQQQPVVVMAV